MKSELLMIYAGGFLSFRCSTLKMLLLAILFLARFLQKHHLQTFSSVTEQERHRKLVHYESKIKEVVPENSRKHKYTWKIDGVICGVTFETYHRLQKHKKATGHKRNRSEIARKQHEAAQENANKQSKEKSVAKNISKQKKVTSWMNAQQSDESEDEKQETDEEEEEEEEEDSETESESQGSAHPEDDIHDDDCNARPCRIEDVISKSKERVDWIQCRSCPKWYHTYCVNAENDLLFECDNHS